MPGASVDMRGVRDTDADWRELGATQPYFGVLSHADFLSENITPPAIEAFYATGQACITEVVGSLERTMGSTPAGRALDFGCGVGRLAEAMCAYADPVTGYDISPGMLALARQRGGAATYVGELPDGPFDWINSFIVFQHIPPARGFAILKDLMTRLAPRGVISLQFTVWREARLEPPSLAGWKGPIRAIRRRLWLANRPKGDIRMYDYDLSQVVRVLNRAGIEEMHLVSTDHAGHHGVIILGRRTVA